MVFLGASLILQQQDKLVWAACLALLGIAAVIYTYARFPQRGGWKWAAALLKILGILLLLFCVLEPLLARKEPKKGANIFLVVGDNSESLQIKDTGADEPRGELVQKDLVESEEKGWLKDLNEEFKVHRFLFGERLQRVNNFEALNFEDRSSSLHGALDDISQRYEDRPLAGIFVFTDGNVNDLDAKLAKLPTGDIPIYPVNIAGESSTRDTSIRQVSLNQSAFEDAPVTVNAEVVLNQVANEPVEVTVYDKEGNKVDSQTLNSDQAIAIETVSFQLKPGVEDPLAFYEVRVSQTSKEEEEPEEATTKNNMQSIVAVMPHGPYSVLYIGGRPDPSFKFFKRALSEDHEVELASLIRIAKREPKFQYKGREGESSNPLFRGFRGEQDTEDYDKPVIIAMKPSDDFDLEAEFPKTDDQLFQFSAIVIDKMEAEFFTFNQQERLQQFVSRRGGGVLMFGGRESFAKGKYDKTPIGEMLPIYLNGAPTNREVGAGKVNLSREGWLQPWVRLRSERGSEEARLADIPALSTVNTVGDQKPGSSLVSYYRQNGKDYPLLVTQSFGKGKSVALTAGDLWRWGFSNPDHPEFMGDLNKFYRQLMRWVITDVPKPVAIKSAVDGSRFPPKVSLEVEVNDRAYFPDSTAEVIIEITDPEGKTSELRAALSSQDPGVYVTDYTAVNEGFYSARTVVKDEENEPLGEAVTGWTVNSGLEEFQNLSGNAALLDKLAGASGGEVVEQSELASFVEKLKEKPLPVMETRTSPLWHLPVFFLLALLCFAGEWGLKRWKGLP
ncbi:hypothetical protein OAL27_00105 [Verrucomicrobiales bacterium]|jgi:uncharacterized membrane protein|nr:hypothetical protein [Verrucomicrobiales bacterium]MDF1785273.1 hypothetical protein [Verrucomicrobiales bacterium]